MTEGPRSTAWLAAAWGLVATVAIDAALRIGQCVVATDTLPAVAGWSVHAGFFWRAWTCAFAGGIAAFVVFALLVSASAATRRLRAARALAPGIALTAALLAVQTIWFP